MSCHHTPHHQPLTFPKHQVDDGIFDAHRAAKTALLLDQTQLGASSVHVQAAQNFDDIAGARTAQATEAKDENHHDLEQEDKPRSRIVAEYLAHGYALSDTAIQKAIALDSQHGFSSRFMQVLSNFDKKYQATDRARGLDQNYKLSDKATSGWRGLNSYFEKAMGTPSGRKLRDFYLQTDKHVREVHNEARRLADLKNGKGEESQAAPAASGAQGPDVVPGTPAPAQPTGAAAPTESKA